MDELVKRLCLKLATTSTAAPASGEGDAPDPARRGFLRAMGKLTVGAAAAVAGVALLSNKPAEAARGLACCEGIACRFHGCLHGMAIGYTWSCGGYFCHDCFTDYGNGNYHCTYVVARARARTTSSRRGATTAYYAPPPPTYYDGPPGYFGG